MALTLEHITVEYRTGVDTSVRALDDARLTVAPGELVLVVGPSGSGKTTLLRVAAGLLKPEGGSVRVAGGALKGPASPDRSQRVGLLFQDPETQLFAETVLGDVEFGPLNLRLDQVEARARRALAAVGLDPDEFAERSPFALSGGQARRVALAGVLAMDPAYLLLDEPTAGLDADGRAAVLASLRGARDAGTGVAVVTHDPEELLGDADRVVTMGAGRVVRELAAADLIADPEPLRDAGLAVPDVLEVQARLAEFGVVLGGFELDPQAAADLLAAALPGSGGR